MSVKGTLVRCSSGGRLPSFTRRWYSSHFADSRQPDEARHRHRDAQRAEDHEPDPPAQVVAEGGQGHEQHGLGEDLAHDEHGLDGAAHQAAALGLPDLGEHGERQPELPADPDAGHHAGHQEQRVARHQAREQRTDAVHEHAEGERLAPAEHVAHPAEEEPADQRRQPLRGDRADHGLRRDAEGAGDVDERVAEQVELDAVEDGREEREQQGEPQHPRTDGGRGGGVLDGRHRLVLPLRGP
jgi:hypothetical protein